MNEQTKEQEKLEALKSMYAKMKESKKDSLIARLALDNIATAIRDIESRMPQDQNKIYWKG